MTPLLSLIGLGVVLLTGAGILMFTSRIRNGKASTIRLIPEVSRLRRALGLSVEAGTRVHIGLGNSPLTNASSTTSLSGVNTLLGLGLASSTSDHPPLATGGDGSVSLLSKDVLRSVSTETNTRDLYDPDHGVLTGVTPFSYAMGTMDLMRDPGLTTNLLVGTFGAEAGYLSTGNDSPDKFTLAVSDSLVGQSVFFAAGSNVLIGEELFALPAYLAAKPSFLASLKVQDILRLLLCLGLVTAAVLKVLGII